MQQGTDGDTLESDGRRTAWKDEPVGISGFLAVHGTAPYEQYIEELNGHDVRKFDADHILIPPMTKADLENLAEKLR